MPADPAARPQPRTAGAWVGAPSTRLRTQAGGREAPTGPRSRVPRVPLRPLSTQEAAGAAPTPRRPSSASTTLRSYRPTIRDRDRERSDGTAARAAAAFQPSPCDRGTVCPWAAGHRRRHRTWQTEHSPKSRPALVSAPRWFPTAHLHVAWRPLVSRSSTEGGTLALALRGQGWFTQRPPLCVGREPFNTENTASDRRSCVSLGRGAGWSLDLHPALDFDRTSVCTLHPAHHHGNTRQGEGGICSGDLSSREVGCRTRRSPEAGVGQEPLNEATLHLIQLPTNREGSAQQLPATPSTARLSRPGHPQVLACFQTALPTPHGLHAGALGELPHTSPAQSGSSKPTSR